MRWGNVVRIHYAQSGRLIARLRVEGDHPRIIKYLSNGGRRIALFSDNVDAYRYIDKAVDALRRELGTESTKRKWNRVLRDGCFARERPLVVVVNRWQVGASTTGSQPMSSKYCAVA